ncbi:M23 family metallopeptidase [Streptomyces sulphureus]|uniref:M23 family metallopeptidase n=1 Tax=Streptomyces sulphureus TaxID=47758 RepID=UPI0006869048|nr:M23 family metallopeptidase [Streptomyces sulphureus]
MAVEESSLRGRNTRPVEISLPFTGRWLIENSPARRVPSHGTDLFGGRYAIDFVGVDERHRTSGVSDWRTLFATEPPERFVAFGRPLLAPGGGTVVAVHDAEPDHEARRSRVTLVPYALGQAGRARRGVGAVAGNHMVIALSEVDAYVVLAHCKAGSVRVSPGQRVTAGQHVADCGNSGNSTQPHVHLQVMDAPDPVAARGVPVEFRRFREWPRGEAQARLTERGVPGEGAVVEQLA